MKLTIYRIFILLAIITFSVVAICAQADADKSEAIKAYQAGDFVMAAKLFKKVVSKNSGDADAWVQLGNSYIELNKINDSIEPYEKAINLAPDNENYRLQLATAYLIRRDLRAELLAASILEANPKSAEANFILGSTAYIQEDYAKAVEYASAATKLDPTSAEAYRLLYVSLISNFAASPTTKNPNSEAARTMLKKAVEAFEHYYSLSRPESKKELETELKDVRFFADYYSGRIPRDPILADKEPPVERGSTPLRIIKRNLPVYPSRARARGTEGNVILLISFQPNGTVGAVMVLKSADKDMDQSAIEAARAIRFEPATKNGTPISVVKRLEYIFSIY